MNKAAPRLTRTSRVLIADDEPDVRCVLKLLITGEGYTVIEADNGETALRVLKESQVDILLLDLMMPVLSGIEVLRRLKDLSNTMPVIVITGCGSADAAIEAGRYGACGFLTKPVRNDEVLYTIQLALENHRFCAAPLTPPSPPYEGGARGGSQTAGPALQKIMGSSTEVQKIVTQIEQVARTDFTVIISGETGVGKEVVAMAIHRNSRRAAGPFNAVDCGSIPPTLIESELFGHEKGAFTGANRSRCGCFETAAGGTLFLDEIGNLPLAMQAKLLRALQERRIYRVGGNTPIPLDVRVLVATNEELLAQVEAGLFRQDLYYRLDEFSIRVPPLRERTQDILFLALGFLQVACEELGKAALDITSEAAQQLEAYSWPGNVRELRNLIRRAALFADGPIDHGHLLLAGLSPMVTSYVCQPQPDLTGALSFRELVRRDISITERAIISQVLEQTGGNMKQTARFLRLDYKTLRTKAKQYSLKTPPEKGTGPLNAKGPVPFSGASH